MRTSYSVIPSETPHPLCPGHSLFYTSRLWGWLFHYHKLSFTTRLSISLFCSVSASLYLPSNRKQDPPVPPKKKREKRKKESKPSALLTFLFICFNCLIMWSILVKLPYDMDLKWVKLWCLYWWCVKEKSLSEESFFWVKAPNCLHSI